MNFGNHVYDYDIPEELLITPVNLVPPPITRQKAYNNLYNINDNYQFVEVNLESPVYRTLEFDLEIPVTTTTRSHEITSEINNNKLPKIKKINTI